MFSVPPVTAACADVELDAPGVGATVPLHAVSANPMVLRVATPASRLDLRDISYSFGWLAPGVRER